MHGDFDHFGAEFALEKVVHVSIEIDQKWKKRGKLWNRSLLIGQRTWNIEYKMCQIFLFSIFPPLHFLPYNPLANLKCAQLAHGLDRISHWMKTRVVRASERRYNFYLPFLHQMSMRSVHSLFSLARWIKSNKQTNQTPWLLVLIECSRWNVNANSTRSHNSQLSINQINDVLSRTTAVRFSYLSITIQLFGCWSVQVISSASHWKRWSCCATSCLASKQHECWFSQQ